MEVYSSLVNFYKRGSTFMNIFSKPEVLQTWLEKISIYKVHESSESRGLLLITFLFFNGYTEKRRFPSISVGDGTDEVFQCLQYHTSHKKLKKI